MQLFKYHVYSCISCKSFCQSFTLKVGVRLTHALHGSVLRSLCKHIQTRTHSRDACSRVRAYTSAGRCLRKGRSKGETNVVEWTDVLYTVSADNLSGINSEKALRNVVQEKVCFV